jgi:hypothetical protein
VSPVKYELGFYIPEDDILHSPRRENLKSYKLIPLENVTSASRSTRETSSPKEHLAEATSLLNKEKIQGNANTLISRVQ